MTEYVLVTLDQAIKSYQLGFVTATGLVRFYLKTGGDRTLTAAEIAKILGIGESTCLKALRTLRNLSED